MVHNPYWQWAVLAIATWVKDLKIMCRMGCSEGIVVIFGRLGRVEYGSGRVLE